MKKLRLCTFALALIFIACIFAFVGCNKKDESLMLHLAFDEGSGTVIKDSSKNREDVPLQYVFNNAQYQPQNQEAQWRDKGVLGGALLFDGYSNYIKYDYEELKIKGAQLTVSAYVAPRAFEWDNPNGQENGNDTLTAIVSQCNKENGEGVILGYQRHGKWSFQVGIGERWITVWCEEGFELKKYEWNHVVGVFNGDLGEICIYLNGQLAGKKVFFEGATILPAVDESFLVGKNSKPGSNATASLNMVSGLMDELKVMSRAMTAEEVSEEYLEYEMPAIEFEDIWLQNILTEDYYKTQLHGGPYQHWMNEPHAPMYYNGVYHLFFQHNLFGPYFRNICWGHLVSTDMVNWKPLKEVITPTAGTVAPDGVWSGGATYDKDGIPLLFFTAGNDSYASDGLISNQNVGVAYPKDINDPYLTEWVVCEELAIKQTSGQGRRGEFRDAHIWKEDDVWCLLMGTGSTSTSGGSAILYTATEIVCNFDGTVSMNWQYKGPVYEMKNQPSDLGSVWELPVILPVENKEGTIKKHVFIISPAPADSADNKIYYFVGRFDLATGKFIPDSQFNNNPRIFDYGCNVFTGPSGMIDPVSGEALIFSIMQDQRKPSEVAVSGWANCVGFVRKIYLSDDGSDACIDVIDALDNYDSQVLYEGSNLSVEDVNSAIEGKSSDMVRIRAKIKNVSATSFGLRVKKGLSTDMTSFTYQADTCLISGATLNKGDNASTSRVSGALSLKNDYLTVDIIIDRSLVEAFFNEEKAVSIRSYSSFDATDIEFFADGDIVIETVKITSLKSIYK